jgi:DNA-directed RNA polymerase specialized sigma subunit
VFRIARHANALRQELGREPTQRELAEELQVVRILFQGTS